MWIKFRYLFQTSAGRRVPYQNVHLDSQDDQYDDVYENINTFQQEVYEDVEAWPLIQGVDNLKFPSIQSLAADRQIFFKSGQRYWTKFCAYKLWCLEQRWTRLKCFSWTKLNYFNKYKYNNNTKQYTILQYELINNYNKLKTNISQTHTE